MDKYRVKNWSNFQHYKDRKPAWIKLHRDILDDYSFQTMPDASRALAPCIWLLASEYEGGEIPADHTMLAFRFRRTEKEINEAIKPLIERGFLHLVRNASKPLADCKQVAMPEKEEEREGEEDGAPSGASSSATPPDCPHEEIIDLYHEVLPNLRVVRTWSDTRKAMLRKRWRESPERQSLDWWRDFFAYVAKSDFLCGRTVGRDGRVFEADLEWLVSPKNFAKVIEGKYE